MKYRIIEINLVADNRRYIEIVDGQENYTFWCIDNNEVYDEFLVDAQLTDTEVHALTPDVWYDFPKETN